MKYLQKKVAIAQSTIIKANIKISEWKSLSDEQAELIEDTTILTDGMSHSVAPNDVHMFEALEDTHALEIYWSELESEDIERLTHGGIRESDTVPEKGDQRIQSPASQGAGHICGRKNCISCSTRELFKFENWPMR
jgi:hypothetical protein